MQAKGHVEGHIIKALLPMKMSCHKEYAYKTKKSPTYYLITFE